MHSIEVETNPQNTQMLLGGLYLLIDSILFYFLVASSQDIYILRGILLSRTTVKNLLFYYRAHYV